MKNNDKRTSVTSHGITTQEFTTKKTKFFQYLQYEDLLEVEGDKKLLLRNRNFIDQIQNAESSIDSEQSKYLKDLFKYLDSDKPIAIDGVDDFKVEKIFSFQKKKNSNHELIGYGIIEGNKKYAIRLEPKQEREASRRFCLYQENSAGEFVQVNDIFHSDSHCKSVFERFVTNVAQINEKQEKLASGTLSQIQEFIANSEKKKGDDENSEELANEAKVADEEVMKLAHELTNVAIDKALEELANEAKVADEEVMKLVHGLGNAQTEQNSPSTPDTSVHQAKIDNLVQLANVHTIPNAVLSLGPKGKEKEYSISYTYTPQEDQNQNFDEAVIKIFIGCANDINKKFSDADKPTKDMSDFISLVEKVRKWGGANYMLNDNNQKVLNTESKKWEKEFSAKFQLATEDIIQLKVGETQTQKMFLYAIPDEICEKLKNEVNKKDDGSFEYNSKIGVNQVQRVR